MNCQYSIRTATQPEVQGSTKARPSPVKSLEKMLLNMSSTSPQKLRHAIQLSAMARETVQIGVTVVTAPIVTSTLESQSWLCSEIHPHGGDGRNRAQRFSPRWGDGRETTSLHTNLAEQRGSAFLIRSAKHQYRLPRSRSA